MDYGEAIRAERHGYVVEIGPDSNPNWFTGSGYSAMLKNAKVFRTARGALRAAQIWQTADYGHALPEVWWSERRTRGVALRLEVQQGSKA